MRQLSSSPLAATLSPQYEKTRSKIDIRHESPLSTHYISRCCTLLPRSIYILAKIEDEFATNMQTHLSICLRELHAARQKQPAYSAGLAELHLGAVTVTATDISTILSSVPTLRILRHYQLVTALNLLHGEQWRRNECLPKYRLRNLDVDFSHVVRTAFK